MLIICIHIQLKFVAHCTKDLVQDGWVFINYFIFIFDFYELKISSAFKLASKAHEWLSLLKM